MKEEQILVHLVLLLRIFHRHATERVIAKIWAP
jgi:hypothetical protein